MLKKMLTAFFVILISFVFLSCKDKGAKYIASTEEFENLFSNSIKYDIRSIEECEQGHIPTFNCMGGVEDSRKLVDTILLSVKDKDKSIIIIANSNDIDRLKEIFQMLIKEKYKNLYSFEGGYENYKKLKGDKFVPEEGCDC